MFLGGLIAKIVFIVVIGEVSGYGCHKGGLRNRDSSYIQQKLTVRVVTFWHGWKQFEVVMVGCLGGVIRMLQLCREV